MHQIDMYPTCAHTQSINDAVGFLMQEHALEAGSVERVDIRTYAAASGMANTNPATSLAARFSIPYTVAVQLVSGHLSPDSFPAEPMADPAVGAMIGRVHLHHDPALDEGYPFRGRPASVAILLKDGRELRSAVAAPRGDALNPVGRDELHRKVRGLLAPRFGETHAGSVFDAALEMGSGGPLSALSAALREASAHRGIV